MDYINIAYVVSAVCFIFGIKMLSHPKTARKGNGIATLGMLVAIAATLYAGEVLDFKMIGIGMLIGAIIGGFAAQKVEMTQMPQLVAIFNGFGGGASALVASAEFYVQYSNNPTTFMLVTIELTTAAPTPYDPIPLITKPEPDPTPLAVSKPGTTSAKSDKSYI